MGFLRFLLLGVLGGGLVLLSVANRQVVTLRLYPEGLAPVVGHSGAFLVPQFVVLFGGLAAGLVVGFVWEYAREHRHRREAGLRGRALRRLEREVASLRSRTGEDGDEVLSLVDRR